jgi:hypothetical protein
MARKYFLVVEQVLLVLCLFANIHIGEKAEAIMAH